MRLSLRFLLLLMPVLAGVAFLFNVIMDRLESQWALKDLYSKASLVYTSIQDPIYDSVAQGKFSALHRIYRRIAKEEPDLIGMLVCNTDGRTISRSGKFPKELKCDWEMGDKPSVLTARTSSGILNLESQTFHRAFFLLFDDDQAIRGYVTFFQDTSYLAARSELARRYAIYAFLALGVFISLITLLVYRWSVSAPAQQISEVMKGVLTGDSEKVARAIQQLEFKPLVQDLDELLVAFRRDKHPRSNGAAKNENYWSAGKLNEKLQKYFGDSKVCVIANDEPYIHSRKGTSVETVIPASGLVSSIEPVLRASSGIWFGRGGGNADRETADKNGILLVPPGKPEYALKRIWLEREEEEGFYYGLASEGLWPLCHIAHERPVFRNKDWEQYVSVNAKFVASFSEEAKSARPIVLVQNYHFALVPSMIRKSRPDALTALFWHIPWPSADKMRICPWRKDLLLGMLGADLIGFQSQNHCNAFLENVDRFLEARVSREQFSVTHQGHTTYVKALPTSVEWPSPYPCADHEIPEVRKKVFEELGLGPEMVMGLGVDRLDYTKGILERLYAIEKLLEQKPDLVGKFVFVQIAAPTNRMHLKRYQDLNSEIQKVTDRINWRFYTNTYQPIVLKLQHHSKEEIYRYYRATNFCFVSPIHDGMNLVSKEFVASRSDEDGVLILSNFTGAARDLTDALIVNPYDTEECAQAIYSAVQMEPQDRKARMVRMRKTVLERNAFHWGSELLDTLQKISEKKIPGGQSAEEEATI